VLLFNIAAVLGPRWIASAAHNGTSSLSLWVLATVLFFFPSALVIVELSTWVPNEGGLYVWTKEAFGDFHGFVCGWCYWVYTIFYFPGLLLASVAMSVYIGGPRAAWLADNRTYLILASIVLLAVAVGLNLVGLHIGKWLQNAGGVGTYVPLVMLVIVGALIWLRHGSVTHYTWSTSLPRFNYDTVNFWSQIAFAFTGLELVCAMSEEIHDPQRTFPRAIFASGVLIAAIYILGTLGVLAMIPAESVNVQNGVFQGLSFGSAALGIAWVGIIAALLVTVGNAGGVGSTVAGVARVPFAVGLDRYLPRAFGKLHPKWRTPYVAILVQGIISAIILLISQINETMRGAYQTLVSAAILLYFLPFLYMYASVIRLAFRADRRQNPRAVLIPGGCAGVIIAGGLGFAITALAMVLSVFPTEDVSNVRLWFVRLIVFTVGSVLFGLILYARGARVTRPESSST
jgi:amino acid transporter